MSRLKGFAAYEGVQPAATYAPALQLLCKEHAKLRKGMEETWKFALKASKKPDRRLVEGWLEREQKLRASWSLHITKEERVLLSSLTKYVDSDRGPLAVMRYEHERLEALFDEFEEHAGTLLADPDNEKAWSGAYAAFRSACQMSGEHCFKEEKTIFALAQNLLTDAEKLQVLQQIRKIK